MLKYGYNRIAMLQNNILDPSTKSRLKASKLETSLVIDCEAP